MKTKILFRTPITNKTGIGHFMRSLSLAFALKKNMNSNIKFVINKNSFALNTLKKKKIPFKITKFNYPSNLNDAKASFEEKTKFIILDSPIVSRKWINYFRKKY